MFIEILFQILLFKGGVLIYAEHCICCLHPNLSILRALENTLPLWLQKMYGLDLRHWRFTIYDTLFLKLKSSPHLLQLYGKDKPPHS